MKKKTIRLYVDVEVAQDEVDGGPARCRLTSGSGCNWTRRSPPTAKAGRPPVGRVGPMP